MAYNIQEQEEIEGFKHFWRSGGAIFCGVVVLAVIGYFGWNFYKNSQKADAAQASVVLTQFTENLMAKKPEDAAKDLTVLKTQHKSNPAAATASLAMAGVHFGEKKYPEAQAELEWVLANNKDEVITALATQRLANLFLQEKKYDQALAAIAKPVSVNFEGVSLDIKGDILYAQGKKKEAAEAYELALAKLPKETMGRQLIELKRDQAKS